MKEIIINGEDETMEFGIKLSKQLVRGSIVALTGDLGAGKTTLTKAIAKGLDICAMITSPTFTIIQEYKGGRLPLYHFDVYRITVEEMYELGFEEYFFGDGVCVIEWADLIEELLPKNTIHIHIEYGAEENQRVYKIKPAIDIM